MQSVRDSFSETGRLSVRHPVLFSLKKTRWRGLECWTDYLIAVVGAGGTYHTVPGAVVVAVAIARQSSGNEPFGVVLYVDKEEVEQTRLPYVVGTLPTVYQQTAARRSL